MKKQIFLIIGLVCLGIIHNQLPVMAAGTCVSPGNQCTANSSNPRGDCCLGVCIGAAEHPFGRGVCGACTGCGLCVGRDWYAISSGYEGRTIATCDCNTCNRTPQYRCAAGYYGVSNNGTAGCTHCPLSDSQSAAGSVSITSCYIPANVSDADTSGAYIYTGNCYYTN